MSLPERGLVPASDRRRRRNGGLPVGPLHDRRIVVTRSRAQAAGLMQRLSELGANALLLPCIRISPPEDDRPLRAAAAAAREADWWVFTSPNGVRAFIHALRASGQGPTMVAGGVSVAAIGPGTAAALRAAGITPEVVAERAVGEGLADALEATGRIRGRRVVLPRAAEGRAVLADRLRAAGARVEDVVAYRTDAERMADGVAADALVRGQVDAVLFASGSAVRVFAGMMGTDLTTRFVSIGPITSAALGACGLPVDAEAAEHTLDGLVEATLSLLAHGRAP